MGKRQSRRQPVGANIPLWERKGQTLSPKPQKLDDQGEGKNNNSEMGSIQPRNLGKKVRRWGLGFQQVATIKGVRDQGGGGK